MANDAGVESSKGDAQAAMTYCLQADQDIQSYERLYAALRLQLEEVAVQHYTALSRQSLQDTGSQRCVHVEPANQVANGAQACVAGAVNMLTVRCVRYMLRTPTN